MADLLVVEDRVSIKIYSQQGHSLRSIADAVGCSPSTVMYELKRGTPERNGDRGRLPSYSAKRGQANYETNRKRCHRNAKLNDLFQADIMVCTKTLYAAVWSGKIDLTLQGFQSWKHMACQYTLHTHIHQVKDLKMSVITG